MKNRILATLLIFSVLLSGCSSLGIGKDTGNGDKNNDDNSNTENTVSLGGLNKDADTELEVNKNTGVEFHDNMPELSEENFDEFLAYFQNSEGFVTAEDYIDTGTPYEDRLQKEAEEMAQEAGRGIKEFYNEQYELTTYFSDFVNDNLDKHNETAGLMDMLVIMFMPFSSWELSLGATLTEAENWDFVSSGVLSAFKSLGGKDAKLVRNGKHDYTATYTNDEGQKVVNHFKANPDAGMQMLSYVNDKLNEIFEYIHEEGNLYIWQSSTERLVLEWDGQKILKCSYTSLKSEAAEYTEKDSIYNNYENCNTDWVKARKEFETQVFYDGNTMKLTATRFLFGGEVEVEIKEVVMPK